MSRNRRRGGALAGIILTMLIVGLVGFAVLVSTGLYIADHVRVSAGDGGRDSATVETPFGTIRVHDHSRFDIGHFGVPLYPGAARVHNSRALASLHFDLGDLHKDLSFSAAEYRTSDSVERVTDFYRSELPHWLISERNDGCMHLSFTKGGYKRIIAIREQDGETRIALASVGEPASN